MSLNLVVGRNLIGGLRSAESKTLVDGGHEQGGILLRGMNRSQQRGALRSELEGFIHVGELV